MPTLQRHIQQRSSKVVVLFDQTGHVRTSLLCKQLDENVWHATLRFSFLGVSSKEYVGQEQHQGIQDLWNK